MSTERSYESLLAEMRRLKARRLHMSVQADAVVAVLIGKEQ